MALLTNAQLQGLASPDLDAGTELDPRFNDPYPDAACWGWALCGGPSLHGNAEPATIFGNAINTNTGGYVTGLKPDFVDWVNVAFGANVNANNQARILSENFNPALIELDDDAQDACRTAFAKLCIIVNGLTIPEAPTNYKIVMASDHWYTWEHWALGLKNNIAAPDNPAWQYTQRDAGVNPVNTRCGHVWGAHPLLTEICVSELQDGHLMYLPHAVGWPAPVVPAAPAEPVVLAAKVDQNGLPPEPGSNP